MCWKWRCSAGLFVWQACSVAAAVGQSVSLSVENCSVVDMESYSGHDGGLIFYSGLHDKVYYEGDSNIVRYSGGNLLSYDRSYVVHLESVHADPVSGQIYQLMSDDSALSSSASFTAVRCLDVDLVPTAVAQLSSNITMANMYSVFIGENELVALDSGGNWQLVTLACGGSLPVASLGPGSVPSQRGCERGRQGGMLTFDNFSYRIFYPKTDGLIYQLGISGPARDEEVQLTSTPLADVCSLSFDYDASLWYFHAEGLMYSTVPFSGSIESEYGEGYGDARGFVSYGEALASCTATYIATTTATTTSESTTPPSTTQTKTTASSTQTTISMSSTQTMTYTSSTLTYTATETTAVSAVTLMNLSSTQTTTELASDTGPSLRHSSSTTLVWTTTRTDTSTMTAAEMAHTNTTSTATVPTETSTMTATETSHTHTTSGATVSFTTGTETSTSTAAEISHTHTTSTTTVPFTTGTQASTTSPTEPRRTHTTSTSTLSLTFTTATTSETSTTTELSVAFAQVAAEQMLEVDAAAEQAAIGEFFGQAGNSTSRQVIVTPSGTRLSITMLSAANITSGDALEFSAPTEDGEFAASVSLPSAVLAEVLGAGPVALALGQLSEDAAETLDAALAQDQPKLTSAPLSITLYGADGAEINLVDLPEPILLTIKEHATEDDQCVFWDRQANAWSTEGLTRIYSAGTDVSGPLVCATTHLSLFGSVLRSILRALTCSNMQALFSLQGLDRLAAHNGWWRRAPAVVLWCYLAVAVLSLRIAWGADKRPPDILSRAKDVHKAAYSDTNHQTSTTLQHSKKTGFSAWLAMLEEMAFGGGSLLNTAGSQRSSKLTGLMMMPLKYLLRWSVRRSVCVEGAFVKKFGSDKMKRAGQQAIHDTMHGCHRDRLIMFFQARHPVIAATVPLVGITHSCRVAVVVASILGAAAANAVFFQAAGGVAGLDDPVECQVQRTWIELVTESCTVGFLSGLFTSLPTGLLWKLGQRGSVVAGLSLRQVRARRWLRRMLFWKLMWLYWLLSLFVVATFIASVTELDGVRWLISVCVSTTLKLVLFPCVLALGLALWLSLLLRYCPTEASEVVHQQFNMEGPPKNRSSASLPNLLLAGGEPKKLASHHNLSSTPGTANVVRTMSSVSLPLSGDNKVHEAILQKLCGRRAGGRVSAPESSPPEDGLGEPDRPALLELVTCKGSSSSSLRALSHDNANGPGELDKPSLLESAPDKRSNSWSRTLSQELWDVLKLLRSLPATAADATQSPPAIEHLKTPPPFYVSEAGSITGVAHPTASESPHVQGVAHPTASESLGGREVALPIASESLRGQGAALPSASESPSPRPEFIAITMPLETETHQLGTASASSWEPGKSPCRSAVRAARPKTSGSKEAQSVQSVVVPADPEAYYDEEEQLRVFRAFD